MYIIKGLWDNQEVYYVGIDKKHTLWGIPVVRLSTSINEAMHFKSSEKANEVFKDISHKIFKIYPVCPVCELDYDGYPAISRADNKTNICPSCGRNEALESFNKYYNLTK